MLVSRSNPPGIESYYYANVFFCFRWKNMAVDHVSEIQGIGNIVLKSKEKEEMIFWSS